MCLVDYAASKLVASAHPLNAWKVLQMLSKARFPLMVLGMLALLTALWGGLVRLGWALAFAMADSRHRPWAFDGLWLSRHSHWRRAGRGPGCLLALCCPAAHRCGHTRPPHRAAGTAVDDAGQSGAGGDFCCHHASTVYPGHRDHGAWRTAVVGGQQWLAGGLASGAGGAVVEWFPGADHRRGAPGIEPFAAAIWSCTTYSFCWL